MKKVVLLSGVVLLLLITSVFAQSQIGLNGVGGRVGYVMPEGEIENTFGFGLNADLGTITPDIKLFAYIDYWGKGEDIGHYEWSYSVFGFAAIAKYEFKTSGKVVPYAGGGLGLNINKAKAEYNGPDLSSEYSGYYSAEDFEVSDTETDLAIHLLGGASMPLSPKMDGFAEIKYTIAGDFDYFSIWAGVNYKLTK